MSDSRRDLAVVVMAAGKGTRMGSPDRAKVLTPLAGRPLLGYVLDLAADLGAQDVIVIAGHQREAVSSFVSQAAPHANVAIQDQQLGTGHAVMQAQPFLEGRAIDVLILSGDVPLLTSTTLTALQETFHSTRSALSLLTTVLPDPTGYGRVVRAETGAVARIVEHKDATPDEAAITEINAGIYIVQSEVLFPALERLTNANAQGEYYLTDIVGLLIDDGHMVTAVTVENSSEVHGINTPADLDQAARMLSERVPS